MTEQQPTVGRIVHYVSYGTPGGEYTSQCRAAIITDLAQTDEGGDVVGVAVVNPTGMFFNRAAYDEGAQTGGTWHWPERS
jgi:hypothetical protein